MYDELLNEQYSRERLQEYIKDAQEWRRVQNAQENRKGNTALMPIRNLLVKVISVFTS